MQNFNPKKSEMKTKIILSIIFISLLLTYSCDKGYEEMNKDPHGFTTASDGSIFNSILSSLRLGWNEQFYINNEILYKQTQLAALTKEEWGNFTIGTEEVWSNYYLNLTLVRDLQTKFNNMGDTSNAVNNMKSMLKIVLAYKTFKLTDLFGDIPFFEAGRGFEDLEYVRPKYDSQESIYMFLLDELKWASENIDVTATQEPYATFSSFDNLLFGDLAKWQKFANSLRLRYAMRMYNKEPESSGEIIKEIIENNLPVLTGYNLSSPVLDNVSIWPYSVSWKNEALNWSFREHDNLRMGSNVWSQMSVNDSSDGSGIFDLRTYLFFETLVAFCIKIGIFIFEGIEIVGAAGDDFLHFIHFKSLDNLEGLHLIQHFVSGTASRIAGINFFFTQNGIIYF